MISCPTCGTSNRPGSSFCNGCGRRVDVVACPSCGKDNPGDSRFCAVCGARLARDGIEALGVAMPGRDPVSLPPSEPSSVEPMAPAAAAQPMDVPPPLPSPVPDHEPVSPARLRAVVPETPPKHEAAVMPPLPPVPAAPPDTPSVPEFAGMLTAPPDSPDAESGSPQAEAPDVAVGLPDAVEAPGSPAPANAQAAPIGAVAALAAERRDDHSSAVSDGEAAIAPASLETGASPAASSGVPPPRPSEDLATLPGQLAAPKQPDTGRAGRGSGLVLAPFLFARAVVQAPADSPSTEAGSAPSSRPALPETAQAPAGETARDGPEPPAVTTSAPDGAAAPEAVAGLALASSLAGGRPRVTPRQHLAQPPEAGRAFSTVAVNLGDMDPVPDRRRPGGRGQYDRSRARTAG